MSVSDAPVAVVTGAAGKLGPVWVRALLDAGYRVSAWVLAGTEDDQALTRAMRTAPDRAQVVVTDVTSRADLQRALDRVGETWSEVPRALVNNAGIDAPPAAGGGFSLPEIPIDDFRRILEVNLLGTFQAMQVVGGAMAMAGEGSIVNIGSLYASISPDARMYDHIGMDPPFLKPPAYGASKAAVVNLTRYFATHLAPAGIRVNALSPGGIASGQDADFVSKFSARVPMGRLGDASELAAPLLFLVSDASSYVTGINLKVDGGFTAW